MWVRTLGPVPDDEPLRAAILAYASDLTLLDAATFAHGRSVWDPQLQMASIDHAMWFHRPIDLSDWVLYSSESPSIDRLARLHAGPHLRSRRHPYRLGGAGRPDAAAVA